MRLWKMTSLIRTVRSVDQLHQGLYLHDSLPFSESYYLRPQYESYTSTIICIPTGRKERRKWYDYIIKRHDCIIKIIIHPRNCITELPSAQILALDHLLQKTKQNQKQTMVLDTFSFYKLHLLEILSSWTIKHRFKTHSDI